MKVAHIHDFGVTLSQYSKNEHNNDFPEFSSCPICKARHPLIKHGFYNRYVVCRSGKCYILYIRRYFCPCCSHTLSVLPSFLHPHFQYSLDVVMRCLEQFFLLKKHHQPFYRQLVSFYGKRFLRNLSGIICFLRDTNYSWLIFDGGQNKKAINALEMISASPEATFSRRFNRHFLKGFMAL